MPRIYCPTPLAADALLDLPAGAARHVQVLRLQPGDAVTLFNGEGGEWEARITRMGRSDVQVRPVAHADIEREAPRAVHLALGMPANERMDWLVEKATELGAAGVQPLQAERGVVRLTGERAQKKREHWQNIAAAAAEQCGRNRVPPVHAVQTVSNWLANELPAQRLLLSLQPGCEPLERRLTALSAAPIVFLSGPEGGLSPAEEQAALAQGFVPVSLGSRILRAETAPLAALAAITLNP
ncbi:MAG: 16S rRNA (uracil(1498)-N(3))-methyltransferase [Gammaproteobacteria bacterium]|nr:16S rRNA (uracil(1498)-N(3))-methyltransferase [Gammaproteobacteria bacterium]